MNKRSLMLAGVTEEDYVKWCKDTKRAPYKTSSKTEFFNRIQEGRLVKDASGKLIKKYKRS